MDWISRSQLARVFHGGFLNFMDQRLLLNYVFFLHVYWYASCLQLLIFTNPVVCFTGYDFVHGKSTFYTFVPWCFYIFLYDWGVGSLMVNLVQLYQGHYQQRHTRSIQLQGTLKFRGNSKRSVSAFVIGESRSGTSWEQEFGRKRTGKATVVTVEADSAIVSWLSSQVMRAWLIQSCMYANCVAMSLHSDVAIDGDWWLKR